MIFHSITGTLIKINDKINYYKILTLRIILLIKKYRRLISE